MVEETGGGQSLGAWGGADQDSLREVRPEPVPDDGRLGGWVAGQLR